MKQLDDFTIKEFDEFKEALSGDEPDLVTIFELFNMDMFKLKFDDFQNKWKHIQNMTLSTKGVKKIYNINGRKFKATLNPLKLKAGQYIDFQTYMSQENVGIHKILSVFLIPQYKSNFFGKYITRNYNDGYDMVEVQKFLYNNMKIGEASELNNFFLYWSLKLIKTMKDYSEKKYYKMKQKQNKKLLKM